MGLVEYKVRISPRARASLKEIVTYISKRSSKAAAEKVRKELIRVAGSLKTNPRIYSSEENLKHLGGEIRSVPKWSDKVIFEVVGDEVQVLNFFHTSRHPDSMEE